MDTREPFNDMFTKPEIHEHIPHDIEVSACVRFSLGSKPCNVCGRPTMFMIYADDPIASARVCCRECLDRAVRGDIPMR